MSESRRTGGRRGRLLALLFGAFAIVVLLDQVTKAMAVRWLEPRAGTDSPRVQIVGDLVSLQFLRNPGAAFGIGSGMTWLLAVIASAVIVAIILTARRLGSTAWAIALGLLLGGALGNLSDRFFRQDAAGTHSFGRGAVVDFINLHFFICNVSDIAITAAAVLMVLLSFRGFGVDGRRSGEDGGARMPASGVSPGPVDPASASDRASATAPSSDPGGPERPADE